MRSTNERTAYDAHVENIKSGTDIVRLSDNLKINLLRLCGFVGEFRSYCVQFVRSVADTLVHEFTVLTGYDHHAITGLTGISKRHFVVAALIRFALA